MFVRTLRGEHPQTRGAFKERVGWNLNDCDNNDIENSDDSNDVNL